MSSVALGLRNVTRRFGTVVALEEAGLEVRAGSVHALLGENGAGKTTLMRIAYGLTRADAGSVVVDGVDRTFRSPADAISAGVGMVQQHPSNVPAMSVWENVLLGRAGRIHPTQARRMVQATAERMGFDLDPDAQVGELTVAAQQRLAILKAIQCNARILILDEPTAILAPEEARDLYQWLRGFANSGGTAVVVTHKLEEARRFTDALTVLRSGRTVLREKSADVTVAALTSAMIGDARIESPPARGNRSSGPVVFRAQGMRLNGARGNTALSDATLEIRSGEIVGVAGVEGSGHHELLLGIVGRLALAGGSASRPESVSLVPEDRHENGAVLDFDLVENVALRDAGRRRGRIGWARMATHTEELIRRFDIRARGARAPMRSLSGGNQQKLVVARELDGAPTLLVAENPTRGLDIRAAAFVRGQLRAAADRGAGVVLYSSDLDEIMELADRVLVVHSTRVTEVTLDRSRIGAAMLGVA